MTAARLLAEPLSGIHEDESRLVDMK